MVKKLADRRGALSGHGKDATLVGLSKGRSEYSRDGVEPFFSWCVLFIVMISQGEARAA